MTYSRTVAEARRKQIKKNVVKLALTILLFIAVVAFVYYLYVG